MGPTVSSRAPATHGERNRYARPGRSPYGARLRDLGWLVGSPPRKPSKIPESVVRVPAVIPSSGGDRLLRFGHELLGRLRDRAAFEDDVVVDPLERRLHRAGTLGRGRRRLLQFRADR